MEFFLEMLLTAVVAVLFSFLVAKLVTVSITGNSDRCSDQAEERENGVVVAVVEEEEELCSGLKMDDPVVQSERRLLVVVDENAELVGVVDEFEEDSVVTSDDESSAAVSRLENVIDDEEMRVCGEDEPRDLAEEVTVRTVGSAESTASVRAEEIMIRGQDVRSAQDVISGEVVVAESEEVRVEESNTVEESEHKVELDTIGEKEELIIEEEDDDNDDWEGIERSELEKAFATASNLLEKSGKAEEISDEVKMELYGLHKIATEGSCRETQPMAIMVSARAKWNAWQKLGNMSQDEAMEKYLVLVSKEIPGLLNNFVKLPETETSVVLPPNSGSLEDLDTLSTTGVESIKNGKD